jgi:hypothetical protein
MKGILLYGHGARNPEWAQPFHRIREAIKARDPRTLVEPGFLELMRPTFDEGVNCLVEQGATKIIVVPIFMAAGSHVKKDSPRPWARPDRCWRRWPTMRWAPGRQADRGTSRSGRLSRWRHGIFLAGGKPDTHLDHGVRPVEEILADSENPAGYLRKFHRIANFH